MTLVSAFLRTSIHDCWVDGGHLGSGRRWALFSGSLGHFPQDTAALVSSALLTLPFQLFLKFLHKVCTSLMPGTKSQEGCSPWAWRGGGGGGRCFRAPPPRPHRQETPGAEASSRRKYLPPLPGPCSRAKPPSALLCASGQVPAPF